MIKFSELYSSPIQNPLDTVLWDWEKCDLGLFMFIFIKQLKFMNACIRVELFSLIG